MCIVISRCRLFDFFFFSIVLESFSAFKRAEEKPCWGVGSNGLLFWKRARNTRSA